MCVCLESFRIPLEKIVQKILSYTVSSFPPLSLSVFLGFLQCSYFDVSVLSLFLCEGLIPLLSICVVLKLDLRSLHVFF